MKNYFIPALSILGVIIAILGCSKQKNNYTTTDHTIGMTNTRLWSGYAYGNILGDTVIASNHVDWPKSYSRIITDSSFPVIRVNGFAINVLTSSLVFRSVDSITKMVRYDSTYASSAISFLVWNFGLDTMRYEFHKISGYNSSAGKYYEENWVLHNP